eukprot:scaffold5641_cov110-Isochrysis_galbana.AAC.3
MKTTGRVRVSVAIGESEPALKSGWPPGSLSTGGTRAPAGDGGAFREPAPPKEAGARDPAWILAREACERTSWAGSAGGESDQSGRTSQGVLLLLPDAAGAAHGGGSS